MSGTQRSHSNKETGKLLQTQNNKPEMKAVGILGSAALVMGTEAYSYDNYRTTGQYGTTGHYGNQYGHGGNE